MSDQSSSNFAFEICPELPADEAAVESLTAAVFGPGMKARAAYALRENTRHIAALSFVAKKGDQILGSVRVTSIAVGDEEVLMLGPLGVLAEHNNLGIGKALMKTVVFAAKEQAKAGGATLMILVGDHAYYAPFGFEQVPMGNIAMPRPVDPLRILVCPLDRNDDWQLAGTARSLAQ